MHVTQLEIQRFKVHTVLWNMIILGYLNVAIFLCSKWAEILKMPSFVAIVLQTRQQHSCEEKYHPPRALCYSTASSLTLTEWLQA